MSIYNDYADKPWMQPVRYTSDADPSHNANARGISRETELVNGVPVVVEGREHYQPTEFGDGRPAGQADRSPMIYRGPNPGAVIDIDDKDELDDAMPQYVPVSPVTHNQPIQQAALAPQPVQSAPPADRFDARLMGIRPQQQGETIVTFTIGGRGFSVTASDLRLAAASFSAWADAASLVKL